MARKPNLGPDWLTDMLVQWGKYQLRGQSKCLGYYTVNPMLRDGIPQPARSHEPTGYSEQDFSQLEAAVGLLPTEQQLAIARYCMPWRIRMIDEANPAHQTTWLYRLKQGLAVVAAAMERKAA